MMNSKTLAAIITLSSAIAAQGAEHGAEPKARPAQCLLEVKGVHYMGGPCDFTPLDEKGSFRIKAVQGLKLMAQVNVAKKDEGRADWNGPLGGSNSTTDLGAAFGSHGCWTASGGNSDKQEDSLICAWGLGEDVYLGPSPNEQPDPKSTIYYGNKVGMYVDIVSRKETDSASATLVTKPSKGAAVQYCRKYKYDYSSKCIVKNMLSTKLPAITANCIDGTFKNFYGYKFAFLGLYKEKNDNLIPPKYVIKDLATGEIADGSEASGYDVSLGIFKQLCPHGSKSHKIRFWAVED